jgi:hypothetical protein
MLEKLRAKPDHVKKSFALGMTIIIFSCILFVWVSSWDARLRGDEAREKTVSPLSGFTTMIEGFISGMRDSISGVPAYVENTPLVATTTQTINEETTATSSPSFDVSGVVVIDSSISTTTSTSTSVY